MSVTRLLHLEHRARVALMGTLALVVALVATAFAVGGSGGTTKASSLVLRANAPTGGYAYGAPALPETIPSSAPLHGTLQRYDSAGSGSAGGVAIAQAPASASVPGEMAAPDVGKATSASEAASDPAGPSLGATKIVKNGQLTIRVDKTAVESAVGHLSALATTEGGYVASSTTNMGSGEPSGEVVLRIPVGHFSDAITKAESYGHLLSLTTSADDVTGHYVDLSARLHALQRTRSTYLTILGRATTIGATLAVQERIQNVQSQIDQLTGQLKVLGNQASYSTLTVDVTPEALAAALPQERSGLSKAWHTSWSRFGRGIDAMVGAIGPLVLALLIMAAVAGVLFVGYRGLRRVTS